MRWDLAALASALAFGGALAFYPVRGAGDRRRWAAWLASSAVVAASPALVPPASAPRLVAVLVAIAVLVKLYDASMEPGLARRLGLWSYLAYLPNGFWLVLRREPGLRPAARDLARLAWTAPAALLSGLALVGLWRRDWSAVPFAVEHALKASSVVLAVVLTGTAAAAAYRLLGGRALDPMRNPLAARTPADFWRRWNRPAQQFLGEYVFGPAGGHRRAVPALLVTFVVSGLLHEYVLGMAAGRVQGCQLLFFSIQGCAAAATMRLRPSGRAAPPWIAATLAFNLATSVLFFRSIDAVLPFYGPRNP